MCEDIRSIIESFQKLNWNKPYSLLKTYLQEQDEGERLVWVVNVNMQFAGYVTLKRHSLYTPFLEQKIPEVMDLNVLPAFRKRGIGSMLLNIAEQEASIKSNIVGLGVGLYGGPDGGYGSAQRIYVKRGYIPDGKGITYNYKLAEPGKLYALDDDLVLWFTKLLK